MLPIEKLIFRNIKTSNSWLKAENKCQSFYTFYFIRSVAESSSKNP